MFSILSPWMVMHSCLRLSPALRIGASALVEKAENHCFQPICQYHGLVSESAGNHVFNTFTNQQDDGKRVMFLGAFDRS